MASLLSLMNSLRNVPIYALASLSMYSALLSNGPQTAQKMWTWTIWAKASDSYSKENFLLLNYYTHLLVLYLHHEIISMRKALLLLYENTTFISNTGKLCISHLNHIVISMFSFYSTLMSSNEMLEVGAICFTCIFLIIKLQTKTMDVDVLYCSMISPPALPVMPF